MSQQINLLNPELRPSRDWLRLQIVAPAALACLVLVVVAAAMLLAEQRSLQAREMEVGAQLKAAQERLQGMTKGLGERTADPALAAQVEKLAAALAARQEALKLMERSGQAGATRFSEVLRGLARQSMDGLWLTAFSTGDGDMEIRGRMVEPSLLPAYIRRLNDEPAFQGRRFDTLDMQGVAPQPAATADGAAGARPAPARPLPRFTEFVLRAGVARDKAPAGGRP